MSEQGLYSEEPAGLYSVRTRDSDEDGHEPQDYNVSSSEVAGEQADGWHEAAPTNEENELQEGMLPRDLPKRTTFYDPVAERQMSQTDAKLFYQRSKTGSGAWSQSTPAESPTLRSGSQTATEYGGDSLILDDARSTDGQGHKRQDSGDAAQGFASSGGLPGYQTGRKASQASTDARATHAASMGLSGSSLFDTEPEITAELSAISKSIQRIVDVRRKYIALSGQGAEDNPRDHPDWEVYPPPPEPAWAQNREQDTAGAAEGAGPHAHGLGDIPEQPEQKRHSRTKKPGPGVGGDFNMEDLLPLPGDDGMVFKLDSSGVYQVFENDETKKPVVDVPTIREFYMNLDDILTISSDGPSKSFAFRRLQYLEAKFNLYVLLNEYQETADTKKVPHRDFYNVRKVDTHVHHSACMNQKHLLRFIKSKMKKFPNEVVLYRDGKHLTLAEVFASINLTAYDLSIDTLDMHAHTDSFHRFDKFNLKYNPIGESRLRTIFLKTDNFISGRYLAEITKEVISDLESSKYQMVEWRISIYGKSIDEWDKLAAWVVDNKLFSHNVRWLVQIPRLYDVYKASGLMETFEQIIKNIFQPLFEVTKDPSSHPKLFVFLQRVIGFDSVDDESKIERRLFKKFPVPAEWDTKQNPPYSYWIYHLFSNITSLNYWRKKRGFNTLVIRPHCGEAGDSEHMAVAALCCHSISHGLLLRKVPLLQYVFYLDQIGIAMSPLSNNALFLAYERNPFHTYFKRGLNVSLSSDDPLQFAFTKEALIEEYAVAAQIYKLSPVDMCELAKNSVKQSGYEKAIKTQWLGPHFDRPGKEGNTMVKTNVPDRREEFRFHTLMQETDVMRRYVTYDANTDTMISPMQTRGSFPQQGPLAVANHGTAQDGPASSYGGLQGRNDVPQKQHPSWDSGSVVADPHLSGSDPRMFPGVLTRGHRTNSLRNLSQSEEVQKGTSNENAAAEEK